MLAASIRRAVLAALITAVFSAGARTYQAPRPQPTFRSISTLVPLDVRVLDRDGHPITDLKQSDFTVLEDGVVQNIAHFSMQTLQPETDKAAVGPLVRGDADGAMRPTSRRVILIVLGRGFLEFPFNAVSAAADFVRTQLLPQDYVAVMGYNRATEFTTDHVRVAAVLDRFRERHANLERRLEITVGGLSGLFGSRRIPASMQAEIDAIFGEGHHSRQVQNDPAQMDEQVRRDIFRDMERLMESLKTKGSIANPAFDKFLAWIAPTMQDAGNIHAGIEYLRFIDGEKRLIFVTEQGFALPRTESDLRLAEAASDARVAIDTIHTGGLVAEPFDRVGITEDMFRRASALATLKLLAENSGGQRFSTVRPAAAFTRIADSTRFQYVLGYHPANRNNDGGFRRIEVKVNRTDVRVLTRRGYSMTQIATSDPSRMMADVRMITAASLHRPVTDIQISLDVSTEKGSDGSRKTTASGSINATRLGWMKSADGRRRVTLEFAVICVNDRGLLVGEVRQPLDISVTDDDYQKSLTGGLKYSVSVPVTAQPHQTKVIVYDFVMDLLGTQIRRSG